MSSSIDTLVEVLISLDIPTLGDVTQELARAQADLNLARETLIGAQLMLTQCYPRQPEQESAIACALALAEKAEGLTAIVKDEIALALDARIQQKEGADGSIDPGSKSPS